MARGFARRAPIRATQRRQRVWTSFGSSLTQLAPAASEVQTIFTEASIENLGRPTLVRIRGCVTATMDVSATAANSKARIGVGVIAIPTSVSAGHPTPLAQAEVSWIYWECLHIGNDVVADIPNELSTVHRIIDNKAMRKLGPGTTLSWVVEHGAAVEGTPDIEVWASLRILLLPA